uniref:hypothetical protein n=1 Tax=Fulvivirga sp. TaxID=1931237 RepID=UPI00404AE974
MNPDRNRSIVFMYWLVVALDDIIDENEIIVGNQICKSEDISDIEFNQLIQEAKCYSKEDLYKETVKNLKMIDLHGQVTAVAWACIAANSESFMSSSKWGITYKIFSKELKLQQSTIIEQQRLIKSKFISRSHVLK